MERFDHLQSQVDNLEARVRSYEVGGSVASTWTAGVSEPVDPEIEEELAQLKSRLVTSDSPNDSTNDSREAQAEEA